MKKRVKICGKCFKASESNANACKFCGWKFKLNSFDKLKDKLAHLVQRVFDTRIK